MATRGMMSGAARCSDRRMDSAVAPRRPPHTSPLPARAENNFVGKGVILSWLNNALQLRLERIEDVSRLPPPPPAAARVAGEAPCPSPLFWS